MDQGSVLKHHELARELDGQVELVGGQLHAPLFFGEVAEQSTEVAPGQKIEAVQRLIED